ncbi:hypothetical protein [Pyrobaculum sp.]|uniref:hypothetical protein n=1 Tax=Pyrobaculum sp. TaxID=2004705 RepID=UPI003162CEF3
MSLSAEEKRRFLKALEEDAEFRYAVAGLLGLGEVLNELRRLREDFNKYVEKSEKRWRQNEKRWKENEKKWKEWYEAWKEFLEDYKKRWEDANRRFSRIEEALGAVAESQYSRYVWEDLREEIKARGELVIRRVRSAKVDNVDVDLLVETDRRVYVVEVKIRPRVEDVGALLAKAEVVKAALGKETVPILTGTWIGDDVEKYARGKGVLIYSY